MPRLGVVAGADEVQAELALEDPGVAALDSRGHRVARVGPGLVAVEADELEGPAVQEEALGPELRLAEADPDGDAVQLGAVTRQDRRELVQGRIRGLPGAQALDALHPGLGREAAGAAPRDRDRRGGRDGRRRPRRAGLPELAAELEALDISRGVDLDLDPEVLRGLEGALGPREDVAQEGLALEAQPGLAVDAAVAEVVDDVAEGRQPRPLRRVDLDDEAVRPRAQAARDLDREGRVAALVGADALPVQPELAGGHDALEVEEGPLRGVCARALDVAGVGGDELIVALVEAVVGELAVGVGQVDAFPGIEVGPAVDEGVLEAVLVPPARIQLPRLAHRVLPAGPRAAPAGQV